MSWDRVEGNWRQLRGKVKVHWGKLTDDQIDQVAGRRDQLVGLVHAKYGIERDRTRCRPLDTEAELAAVRCATRQCMRTAQTQPK
jgi:uncharacterized protein YjbJ (UPF0337 family)